MSNGALVKSRSQSAVAAQRISVNRWGSSLGVRLPAQYCKDLDITAGTVVTARIDGDCILIEKEAKGATIQERMRGWDGVPLPAEEVDWGTPVGKEVW